METPGVNDSDLWAQHKADQGTGTRAQLIRLLERAV